MTLDPFSFLCGVVLGLIVARCIFFYWKEQEESNNVG
jgi:hypothetical protein